MKSKLLAVLLLAGGALFAAPQVVVGIGAGVPSPAVYEAPVVPTALVGVGYYYHGYYHRWHRRWAGPYVSAYVGPYYGGGYWVGPRWYRGRYYRGYWRR